MLHQGQGGTNKDDSILKTKSWTSCITLNLYVFITTTFVTVIQSVILIIYTSINYINFIFHFDLWTKFMYELHFFIFIFFLRGYSVSPKTDYFSKHVKSLSPQCTSKLGFCLTQVAPKERAWALNYNSESLVMVLANCVNL